MAKNQKEVSAKPKNFKVGWNDPPLERWLGEITRNSTRSLYKSAWKNYAMYTGKTATELIDEATEDMKKDPKDKKGVVLQRLLSFHKWLSTEYPVVSRGKGKGEIIRKGLRPKTAFMKVQVIRSFYGTFGITVKMKGKSKLPRPRVYNKRLQLSVMDVKLLVDHARLPRDRAIILTLFQGGLDSSTVCSINYEDVKAGIATDEKLLKLNLYREKSGVDYYTFLGRDAINSIKAYLNDLRSKGIILKNGDPLFVKRVSRKPQRMNPELIQKILRDCAMRSKLVDENLNGKDQNPASPHALREAFGSIMVNKGVPDTVVDFWLGHTLSEMAQAYKGMRFEELKRLYRERERFISITAPESDIEERLRSEYEEKIRQLQTLLNSLLTENVDLKKRVGLIEDWVPKIKDVVRWHKEVKVENQLEEESMRYYPHPPEGWYEKRKKELLSDSS